jgi:hypothetical protein
MRIDSFTRTSRAVPQQLHTHAVQIVANQIAQLAADASRGAGVRVGAVVKESGLVGQTLRNRINAAKAGSVNDRTS